MSTCVFNMVNICCLGVCSQTAYLQLYSSLVVVVQDYPDAAVLVVGHPERDHAQDLHVLEASVSATRQSDLFLHSQMYTSEKETEIITVNHIQTEIPSPSLSGNELSETRSYSTQMDTLYTIFQIHSDLTSSHFCLVMIHT